MPSNIALRQVVVVGADSADPAPGEEVIARIERIWCWRSLTVVRSCGPVR